jgi:hypothetical protein
MEKKWEIAILDASWPFLRVARRVRDALELNASVTSMQGARISIIAGFWMDPGGFSRELALRMGKNA